MHTIEKEEGGSLVLLKTYLDFVNNSVGTAAYRNVHIDRQAGGQIDVTDNGDLSCAYFVSSVLRHFHLIEGGFYTTIDFTVEDMLRSGWVESLRPAAGVVVVWSSKMCSDGPHRHIGICVDCEWAVSNCPVGRSPRKHGVYELLTEGGALREVDAFYTHPKLGI
ncbi:hypothetical protein KC851_01455 [Candidatus Kaiserbacteria bacterium]|nr:hypothetical protein [Candidatus Kaiserbacteria bacterium]